MLWVRATVEPDPGGAGPYESIGESPTDYVRSQAHETAGISAADANVLLRLPDGTPDAVNGRLQGLGIGMSNASIMFNRVKGLHENHASRMPRSYWTDGAKYGQTAEAWADPNHVCWQHAIDRVEGRENLDMTPLQVGVVHIMMCQKHPHLYGDMTQQQVEDIVANVMTYFPNTGVMYLSGLNYTGYSANPETGNTTLAPEPYVYNAGILMANMVKNAFAFPVWTDFLDFWADGINVNPLTGLSYLLEDLEPDGVHQSALGREKMANFWITRMVADPVMQGRFFEAA